MIEEHNFVVVDFWAEWCGPCKSFSTVFAQVAELHPDMLFGTLDTDKDPEIAAYFNIKQIPCIIAIRNQVIIDGQVGSLSKAEFEDLLMQWRAFDTKAIHQHFEAKIVTIA